MLLGRRHKRHYARHKEAARGYVHARIVYYNRYYNFSYRRVFIKNSKSRWGSCSEARNLNFNYKLLFLPPAVADYVIVHELCHLREFNHGPKFWALVAQALPDHKARRTALRALERSTLHV